jgi:transposase-like protein
MNRIHKAMYTREFREETVKLAMTDGVGVSEAARQLLISMKTLGNWVRGAKAGKLHLPMCTRAASTPYPNLGRSSIAAYANKLNLTSHSICGEIRR